MYKMLQFAQFFALSLNFAINIWLFAIFPVFADYWSRGQGLSKSASNVKDLYHNKKIEGGQFDPPPRDLVMKPGKQG